MATSDAEQKRAHAFFAAQEGAAKARAKRAGRRYPNLIDNMRAATKK